MDKNEQSGSEEMSTNLVWSKDGCGVVRGKRVEIANA